MDDALDVDDTDEDDVVIEGVITDVIGRYDCAVNIEFKSFDFFNNCHDVWKIAFILSKISPS